MAAACNSPYNASTSSETCNWADALQLDDPDITGQNNPATYVHIVLFPVMLTLCTVGSMLTFVVLGSEKPRTSANVYLMCIAIGNLGVLWSQLPAYVIEAETTLDVSINGTMITGWLEYSGFGSFWTEASIQFSDWTLIIFSIERLLVVRNTTSGRLNGVHGIRKAVVMEIFVLILAALFSLSYLATYYYSLVRDDGETPFQCWLTPKLASWSTLQDNVEVGHTIAKWIAVLVINAMLIFMLFRHEKGMQRVTHLTAAKSSRSSSRNSRILVLTGAVTLYTVSQLPNVVFNGFKIASQPPYCTYNFTEENTTSPIVQIILLTNYSLAFFVYCLVSRKFRRQLQDVFRQFARQCKCGAVSLHRLIEERSSSAASFGHNSASDLYAMGNSRSRTMTVCTDTMIPLEAVGLGSSSSRTNLIVDDVKHENSML